MRVIGSAVIVFLLCILLYLAAEGLLTLLRGGQPGIGLAVRTYQNITGRAPEPAGGASVLITQPRQFKELIGAFQSSGVGLGNTPFRELRSAEVAINYYEKGCLRQKANLDKALVFLRTSLYDPFDPPNAFFDTQGDLEPKVAALIKAYGLWRTVSRSNAFGERLTLPLVERFDKVIVAGDSVANGVGVNDEETLASLLQQQDMTRQYVNIGVSGAEAADNVCNLISALARYKGQVRELIYIYTDNDIRPQRPYGTPEALMGWLTDFIDTEAIEKVTIVFAPYIYNIFPEVTRIQGQRGWNLAGHEAERATLKRLVDKSGFAWIDIAELALPERDVGRGLFSGLALFIDHMHLSPYGLKRLAKAIRGHISQTHAGRVPVGSP